MGLLKPMLPDSYCQPYQTFQRQLEQLQAIATQANLIPVTLQTTFLEAQQFFQQKISSLDLDQLEPADSFALLSIQTEINKQLRMLGMDVMFLQAARQATTAHQRQKQMGDRINTLLQFCQAVLQKC